MFKKSFLAAVLLTICAMTAHAAPTHTDASIAKYKTTGGVTGNLFSSGSNELNNLMVYWAEGFKKMYPRVNIQIDCDGSTTALPALVAGTAQLGPMSRKMDSSEIAIFEKKYGFKPTRIAIAFDSLVVFVNEDNPIKCLSLDEVDAIFSSTRKRGLAEITTWGQLGVTGQLADMPINPYGRDSASAAYDYFKERMLKDGDYKNSVKELPDSSSIVEGIALDVAAIGFSNIGFAPTGVRVLPLSDRIGGPAGAGNCQNVPAGNHPLSRMFYIYVAKKPGQPLPRAVKEFLKFALSKEGQEITVKNGYEPLTARMIADQMKALK